MISWPRQARTVLSGWGTCVGATYDVGVPRLGRMTAACEPLIKLLNQAIRNAIGDHVFYWGSLQINRNAVATPHRDSINESLFLIMLFGRFDGGAFKQSDGKVELRETGRVLVIDGHLEHFRSLFKARVTPSLLFSILPLPSLLSPIDSICEIWDSSCPVSHV